MRLKLSLPDVRPDVETAPTVCPHCSGTNLQAPQQTAKAVRELQVQRVVARRYACRRCGHTFRVYPPGPSHSHTSERLLGTAIVLNFIVLSYAATAQVLDSLGHGLSKTAISNAVRERSEQAAAMRRRAGRFPCDEPVGAGPAGGTIRRCPVGCWRSRCGPSRRLGLI